MKTKEKAVVLDVRHLLTEFGTQERPLVAVDDVSFQEVDPFKTHRCRDFGM